MKTNAIIRIILYSIAILVLLGILLTGLLFGLYSYDISTSMQSAVTTDQVLPVASDGLISLGAVSAEVIKDIEIEWVAGSITIQPDENTDQITIAETDAGNDKYRMVYRQSGDTLKIQYCKDSITFPSFGINVNLSKDLVITVPADWICNSLEIDAAAVDVVVNDLILNEVDFDGASGTCDFINCQVGQLDLDGASGDVNFTGTLNVLDFDGASASCTINVTNVPDKITMDGMSGDLDLTLPEDCGFTVSIEALSSDFRSDFPTSISNGNYVYGDGHCRISLDGMSGDLTIRKAQ